MESLSNLMAEDAGSMRRLPTDQELSTVSELVELQLRLQKELSEQEKVVSNLKELLTRVQEVDLPNAVEKFGFSEFKLLDGRKVTIKEQVHAGITQENQSGAFLWLEETGNDGIIKNEVKCAFGKGQRDEATELMLLLSAKGFSYDNKRSVHHSTLRAFIKDQLEQGAPIPIDLFSVHVQKIAEIK